MPRAEEDTTPKGQAYGAEKEQNVFKAAMKPVQVPVQFPSELAPPDETEPTAEPADQTLEVPGLGNLGDILFADGGVSHGIGAGEELPFTPAGPHGPPPQYQNLMRDPKVSDSTRALVSLVARLQMLGA